MVRRPADFSASVSVISRIETFGYPQITPAKTKGREALSKTLPELPLSGLIASRAIFLRQQGKMGLADAIFAGTALGRGLPSVKRSTRDFKHFAGLRLIDPLENVASARKGPGRWGGFPKVRADGWSDRF